MQVIAEDDDAIAFAFDQEFEAVDRLRTRIVITKTIGHDHAARQARNLLLMVCRKGQKTHRGSREHRRRPAQPHRGKRARLIPTAKPSSATAALTRSIASLDTDPRPEITLDGSDAHSGMPRHVPNCCHPDTPSLNLKNSPHPGLPSQKTPRIIAVSLPHRHFRSAQNSIKDDSFQ